MDHGYRRVDYGSVGRPGTGWPAKLRGKYLDDLLTAASWKRAGFEVDIAEDFDTLVELSDDLESDFPRSDAKASGPGRLKRASCICRTPNPQGRASQGPRTWEVGERVGARTTVKINHVIALLYAVGS